ncbi:MAG: phosphoribosylaminoimidazole-succinocarboxamide synthase [Flavobacteriales bacterium]|jgi:phosphoribosylaminoimidazole-succinocarboxamide synthase
MGIKETNFNFTGQVKVYNGKVRDVYFLENDLLVMVASDRISAFDHILPAAIPFKGQVLNQVATKFLKATEDIVPNWLIDTPDPNVAVGYRCEPIMLEMVIRGYLTGHAWRLYNAGQRIICGVTMPEGMKEHDKFPEPIITPATKAVEGHDEDISREEIIAQGIADEETFNQLAAYTRALFERGTQIAAEKELILVDTKYEFGMRNGTLTLMDEIHTPDSSRYFYADGYAERQANNQPQKQLSKEFVREWLMENNFMGKDGQSMPAIPEEFIQLITTRYIELFEKVTGGEFIKSNQEDIDDRIFNNVEAFLEKRNS